MLRISAKGRLSLIWTYSTTVHNFTFLNHWQRSRLELWKYFITHIIILWHFKVLKLYVYVKTDYESWLLGLPEIEFAQLVLLAFSLFAKSFKNLGLSSLNVISESSSICRLSLRLRFAASSWHQQQQHIWEHTKSITTLMSLKTKRISVRDQWKMNMYTFYHNYCKC